MGGGGGFVSAATPPPPSPMGKLRILPVGRASVPKFSEKATIPTDAASSINNL